MAIREQYDDHETPAIVADRHRARRRFLVPIKPAPRAERAAVPITEGVAAPATAVREGLYRRMLALADASTAAVLGLFVLPQLAQHASASAGLLAIPLMVLIAKIGGLYERDELVLKKTTLDEAPRLLQLSAIFALTLWLFHDGWTVVELDASDVMIVWGSAFVLVVAGRTAARALVGRVSAPERCVIVGEPRSIEAVHHKLRTGRVHVDVVGSLETDGSKLGHVMDQFRAMVARTDVQRVIIALGAASSEKLALVRVAKHAGVRVSVVPRMLEVVGSAVEFDYVDGLTMLGVRRFGLTRSSHALKRAFDLAGAGLAMLVLAPLMLAISVAIRLDSRGPTFFRQTRVGKDGRRFEMVKFRSMVADAETRKAALRPLNETEGLFKIESDPRITGIGRMLRRTSLDELPQLLNVWRGEMSLVGPRPLVVDEDEQVQGWDRERLHLTPGMTGHWQILGAARIPMHEMVSIDYLYIANWSLWTDVKILLRTIPYVLAGRGM